MVDAVGPNATGLQRAQTQQTAPLRGTQKIAQTLINQLQNAPAAPVKAVNAVAPTSKIPGFSGNVPRGSLVDIIV